VSALTQDVFVVLWDEGGPVLPVGFLQVYVDETVSRSVQVGAEREHAAFIGDVGVLSFKVVHQLHPWQQACRTGGDWLHNTVCECEKELLTTPHWPHSEVCAREILLLAEVTVASAAPSPAVAEKQT